MTGEFQIIRDYFQRPVESDELRVGIGDDGAVLRPREGYDQVVVTDTLVEGRHFPAGFAAEDIGWRALAVNLSDIAAMGAVPRFAFLNLTLPIAEHEWLSAFARGFFALAEPSGVTLAGGDTTQGPLSLTVTVFGDVDENKAVLRNGAKPGDRICVSGSLGDAAAGLEILLRGASSENVLVSRFRKPEPRLALGRNLAGTASAAIDISDGLMADLGHILEASGVGARVELSSLPISSALADYSERAPDYALAGGDDYELCFCLSAKKLAELRAMDNACDITCIGEVTSERDLVILDNNGNHYQPSRRSWEHFMEWSK
ncbi:MAG: thiamine-phosphate kinase [Proteobacteria bacterium]|nr:thiamine-phosphate kinase [Pseudomonadota bacterium]